MKLNRRGALGIAAAAIVLAGGGAAFAATSADPPSSVTAVTQVQNDGDSGNGGIWAIDQMHRTLTVADAAPNTAPSGSVAYTATVADTGTFTTVAGALDPNQVIPGQRIAHAVSGDVTCSASYAITAPSPTYVLSSLANAGLPASINDNFQHVSIGPLSFSGWPAQAFSSEIPATDISQTHYNCVYTTAAGESWTDSDTNDDGNLVQDGNITGLLAPPPVIIRLSHGQGTATAPTRETVSFQQSGTASWDEFYIVGPGPINGHKGWVNGKVGLNFGYYEGLEANHGYTVYYTPVEGQGSNVQVPDAHPGDVYFVS
jgi:hypothetical protein